MKKKKAKPCPKLSPEELHDRLGRVLIKEINRPMMDARDAREAIRILPPSSAIPFLP